MIDLSIFAFLMGSFIFGFGLWILSFYYQVPKTSLLPYFLGDSIFVILGIGLIALAVTTFKKARRKAPDEIEQLDNFEIIQ